MDIFDYCGFAPNIDPVFALKTSPAKRTETQCMSAPGANETGQSSIQIGGRIGSNFSANLHDEERDAFAVFIAQTPMAGSVVRGSGGVRKVR